MASGRNNRRRRRKRSRLGFLLKLLCAAAVVGALTVGATVFFRVEDIVVEGNRRYTQEEIVAITGISQGDNLYGINKIEVSSSIRRQLPYIEGVNIRRNLPSTIRITVDECGTVVTVAKPEPLPAAPEKPEKEETEEKDGEEEKKPEKPAAPASEAWLMSLSGKLLEPAGGKTTGMLVSGITPLEPESGAMLVLPENEEFKRTALMGLFSALEELDLTEKVSSVSVHSTWMDLRYMDKFNVRMPLDKDFVYKLNVLEEVAKRTAEKHGEQAGGRIDLTREDCDAGYSPEE